MWLHFIGYVKSAAPVVAEDGFEGVRMAVKEELVV